LSETTCGISVSESRDIERIACDRFGFGIPSGGGGWSRERTRLVLRPKIPSFKQFGDADGEIPKSVQASLCLDDPIRLGAANAEDRKEP
jgi:hypothetical protein